MNVYDSVLDLIGNTPLVEIKKLNKDGKARVFVKLESKNPAGSIKDRPALKMIEEAEKSGLINKDTLIIEPTSGNTGVGLAMVCAVKGYKMILTMPESMSLERRALLKAYGAELVLTPKEKGMQGAVDKAVELMKEYPNSFMPQQFNNPANPLSHELSTAKEIIKDTDGKIDIFISAFGTAGTLSGCGKVLKEFNPSIKVFGVEPETSPLISQGTAGPHKIQGIGANFRPQNFNAAYVDEVLTANSDIAMETARKMASQEGILCGISSGANVAKALELAKLPENEGKIIVTVICDTGERYLTSELFNYGK
ncbi:MAG: cysteine synthase A [Fusobacterium sp.]|nr:cysteine synthase A [Fusobacterium sp.]